MGAKPFVALCEMKPFDFAGSTASSRPKTQARETNGGFAAARRTARDSAVRNGAANH
jgi:hypothetical protein